MKVVGVGLSIFTKAVQAVIGGQMLTDVATFVQLFDTILGGFRKRAQHTYELLRQPGTTFVVVSTCEPDALREASYFTDRLRQETMPLAGVVLNRTHPPHVELTDAAVADALHEVGASDPLTSGVLQVHADRLQTRVYELRMRARFERAHPDVPVCEVPALPTDAHDMAALREIGAELAG